MNVADARGSGPGAAAWSASSPELAAALAELPVPVFMMSPDRDVDGAITELRYTFLNEAASRLLNRPVAPLLGRGLTEVFPSVRELGVFAAYAGVIDSGRALSFEIPAFDDDGVSGPFELTVVRFGTGVLVSARDTTRERETEAELAETSRRYELVAQNASDFVAQCSADGVLTWVSPSVTGVLGWRPDELVGRSRFELIHPDTVADERAASPRLAAGEAVSARRRILCADGSYLWVSRTWRPIRDASGMVVGSVGGFRDIEAEVAAERALAESERRFRMVAENAADFVWLAGADTLAQWVSPAVTHTLGWAAHELVGTRLVDLIHPDDLPRIEAVRAELFHGERVVTPPGGFLIRVRTRSGEYRWMSGSATPVTDESGATIGVVSGLSDVDDLVVARAAAQEDRAHLRATVDSLLDPHVRLNAVRDEGGQIVDFVYAEANPAACEYNQIAYADLIGTRLLDVFAGHAGTDLLAAYRGVVETGQPLEVDDAAYVHEILSSERRYDIRAARVGDGMSLTWRDVTERHAAAESLARSEAQYRLLAENASDVVLQLAPDGTFEWVSESVTDLLGWRPQDVVGHQIDEFIHADDVGRFRQAGTGAAPGSTSSVEVRFRRSDGTHRWIACRMRTKLTADGEPVAVVGGMVDVEDRKAAEELLSFSASHDPLTGLANRAMLLEETERALAAGRRSGRPTALMLLDLDHFKNVNDAMGHTVGDELLRVVAGRIASSVRSADLVARHGGDEFVVLQRDLHDFADAQRLAERLVAESREPVVVGGTELFATASVGVAVADPSTSEFQEAVDLIREADTAMYAAKVAGRDRVAHFNEDLRRVVHDRLHLEGELRRALGRDELALWYQPEIDLRDGTVRAAEALLRWHHPDGQVRVAGQFIDVAEDSGLILEIGSWVLRRSCADAARWATGDPSRRLVLRVNLSALELRERALLTTLDEALTASGLDPDLLCIEITESAMLSESATVKANLDGIRRRGIELAIDDFGTGYGSLTYLRRYAIDVMKVDRSFVTSIATAANDRNLVAGMVALADRLGISVTAEGIETVAQERACSSVGCIGAQGFLYSPALPYDALEEFLRDRESLASR